MKIMRAKISREMACDRASGTWPAMGKLVFLVLLASIHLTNCQPVINYTGNCTKITVEISATIVYPKISGGNDTAEIDGRDFSNEGPLEICINNRADLSITWMNASYLLTFDFTEKGATWEISRMQFEYITSNPDFHSPAIDADTVETDDTVINNVKLGQSYSCKRGTIYKLTSNHSTVYVTLKNLQVQAFKFNNKGEFGIAQNCSNSPTPPTPPNPSNSSVTINVTDFSCILVRIILDNVSISYQNKQFDYIVMEPTLERFNMTNSFCDPDGKSRNANITIGWPIPYYYYSLSISFSANFRKGKQGWKIGGMTFQYINNSDFTNPYKDEAELHYSKDFTDDSIALTRSYKCDNHETYTFKSDDSNSTVTLSVSFIQLQAFKFSDPNNLDFGSAVECDQVATAVIVPILVGSALGLFVLILLVAYVIGRLRQRRATSGYHRL